MRYAMSESLAATVMLLSESVAEAAVAVGVIVLFVASIVASSANHAVLSFVVRVSDENVFVSGTNAAMRIMLPRCVYVIERALAVLVACAVM